MRCAAFGLSATALILIGVSAAPSRLRRRRPRPPAASWLRSPWLLRIRWTDRPGTSSTSGAPSRTPTTRQAVLARDGKDVQDKPDHCQPASGSWYSVYDDTTVTDVAQATIDHMVPLAEAWRSGADTWTADQRKAFGNDLKDPQLLIASESSNSSKSDSGPAD
ncbi:DUF1524 domain-containing protein [Streptomyces avermitilis]|uniref:GmrSD restriction endonuclease domain-containing protein n=1 Tax=Streptomyces avermitilis TaxID=33903 RepID=UPI0033E86128